MPTSSVLFLVHSSSSISNDSSWQNNNVSASIQLVGSGFFRSGGISSFAELAT